MESFPWETSVFSSITQNTSKILQNTYYRPSSAMIADSTWTVSTLRKSLDDLNINWDRKCLKKDLIILYNNHHEKETEKERYIRWVKWRRRTATVASTVAATSSATSSCRIYTEDSLSNTCSIADQTKTHFQNTLAFERMLRGFRILYNWRQREPLVDDQQQRQQFSSAVRRRAEPSIATTGCTRWRLDELKRWGQ